jgi:ATP-dependent Clp protease ATP-binding subunit ClpA
MQTLTDRLKEQGITVRVERSFLECALARAEGGARGVCRHVGKEAEELLAKAILEGSLCKERDVLLCAENGVSRMKISEKSY